MPVTDNVGYSETTLQKQIAFINVFRMLCRMWKGMLKSGWTGNQILYFDLNGGHGVGHKIPIVGSPVLAAMTLKELQLPHIGYVCERSISNVSILRDALMAYNEFSVIQGDNRNSLIPYLPKDGSSHYGLVYIDSNGYPISEFNFLSDFGSFPESRRIDILISFGATTIKRTDNSHYGKHNLRKYLNAAGKHKWYIRKLMDGKHKWSFLFGTNWHGFPERFTDFHTLLSPEGQSILDFFYNSKDECSDIKVNAHQVSLF